MEEYKMPKSKRCLNCSQWQYENIKKSDRGRCTKWGKCERIKAK